jgi:hypothetical protein
MNTPRQTFTIIAKRLFHLSLVCLALFFLVKTVLIVSTAQSPESVTQERNLKLKTFKGMPVVVHKVRNLGSGGWHKDLEIEVKNISNKPIYFMLAYLIFPDQPVPGDGQAGIRLMYGDSKRNGLIDKAAHPEDEHLEPGETYVFTIPEIDRKGLEVRDKKFPERNKKIELKFAMINFGDRTGFEAGSFIDLRGTSLSPSPPEKQIFKKVSWHSLQESKLA